jgi:hypothetical protein
MKRETLYKEHRIVSRLTGRWFAQIFPPNADRALNETPAVTREEGYDYLLAQAHKLVDRRLDRERELNSLVPDVHST